MWYADEELPDDPLDDVHADDEPLLSGKTNELSCAFSSSARRFRECSSFLFSCCRVAVAPAATKNSTRAASATTSFAAEEENIGRANEWVCSKKKLFAAGGSNNVSQVHWNESCFYRTPTTTTNPQVLHAALLRACTWP